MIVLPSQAEAQVSSGFPDMTALLDVIFILLVFLLLTANTVPKVLTVDLPGDSQAQSRVLEVNRQITLTLFAEGDYWGLAEKKFDDWSSFEAALNSRLQATKQPEIVVAGDKQASLEKTLKLLAWLQKNELSAAQILMTPTSQ